MRLVKNPQQPQDCRMRFILQDALQPFAQGERIGRRSVKQTAQIKAIAGNASDD
jgi:hypothetical protein